MNNETAELIEALRPGIQSMPTNHEAALTLEQKIAICNAVNTAIAKGYIVKNEGHPILGVIAHKDTLLYIQEIWDNGKKILYAYRDESTSRIVAVKEVEVDVIYEPGTNLSAAS
jgi:hypothetical protein